MPVTRQQRTRSVVGIARGDHVIVARKTEDDTRMGLYKATVVDDGSSRIGDSQRMLRVALDGEAPYWERYHNIYEVVGRTDASSDAPTCQGVRRCDFPKSQKEFEHICHMAVDERCRLDADAFHIGGNNAHLSEHIIGFRASTSGADGHCHFMLQSTRLNSEVEVHHFACTPAGGSTVRQRRGHSRRCSSCQRTFDTLRRSVAKRKCASAKRARLGSDNINSKTAHTDMTMEQQGEKLNQLVRQIKILRSKNYRLNLLKLASNAVREDECRSEDCKQNALQISEILSAAIPKARAYFDKVCETPEQSRAAVEMLKTSLSNMASYLRGGTKCGFRYSPACFRAAIDIFLKMPVQAYEGLRAAHPHLPSSRYLRSVITRNAHQPSGVLRADIRMFGDQVANGNLDARYAARVGNLAVDAMTIHRGLAWNHNTGTFAGISDEGPSDGLTVQQLFLERVSRVAEDADASIVAQKSSPGTQQGGRTGCSTARDIKLASHHLVVYYTSLKGEKVSFICARADVATLTVDDLHQLLRQTIRELCHWRLKVASISFDGASENRSFVEKFCNVAAKRLIDPELLREAAVNIVLEASGLAADDFPWLAPSDLLDPPALVEVREIERVLGDLNIGWNTNEKATSGNHIVVVVPDTPHVMKKVVNSLERRKTMELDGYAMSLGMLESIWEAVQGGGESNPGLRATKLGFDHFHRTSMSRMRVGLASQVLSQTMYDLFHVFYRKAYPTRYENEKDLLRPLLRLVLMFNRTFDIMNSRTHDKKLQTPAKKIELINSGNHKHVKELLQTSAFMARWKLQSLKKQGSDGSAFQAARTTAFVTMECGNDAIGIGLGVAALAKMYAAQSNTDGGPLILRRLDQDPCEHHFGHIRQASGHCAVTTGLTTKCQMTSSAIRFARIPKGNAGDACPRDAVGSSSIDLRTNKPSREAVRRETSRTTW